MDKINNENIDINLMKIIMNKKKNQKELLKDIFLVWKNKVISEKKNYIIKSLFIKIINIYQKLYVKNILIKKLYHWKNTSNLFKMKSNILVQRKNLFKICDYIINENIKENSHYFFNKIKYIKRKVNSNDLKFLKKIIICFNKKNIIYILKRYFNKWKSFIFKYKIMTLKGKMIYNLYYKYKNNIHKLLLFKYLNKWKNKNNELSKFENKTIDCKYIDLKNNNKEIIKYIMLKSILIKLNKYYIYNKINKYFNKWIHTNNKNEKLNDFPKLQKLFSIIQNKKLLEERIMKRRLKIWKNNNKDSEKIKNLLENIIKRYSNICFFKKDYYLKRWLFISNKIKIKENGNIIINFCKNKIRYVTAKKKWNNFAKKLYNKKIIININKTFKYYKGFYAIEKVMKEICFKKLIKINNFYKFTNGIKTNIIRINSKANKLLLEKYLSIWYNKINKQIVQQIKINNIINILRFHSINKSISIFNNIFVNKKANNIISRIDIIIKKIIIHKKNYFIENLKAFYQFKILNNFIDLYNKLIKKNLLIIKVKFFFFLKKNNLNYKEYTYKNIISKEIINDKKTNIKFHYSTNKNNRTGIINHKNNIYLILISFLVRYITSIIINKKKDIFYILKKISNISYFCDKCKSKIDQKIIPSKKYLIQFLKNKINNENRIFSNNIYLFLRKLIIKKTVKTIKYQNKLIKLVDLLNITIIHKNISKSRYLLKIIKKWRFVTFIKIINSKKMAIIYNDLHSGYINLVNNILEENHITKSEIDKMSRLDMKQFLYNLEDPLIIKNNELKYENILKKQNKIPSIKDFEKENIIDNSIGDSSNLSQKINLGNNMIKDISFVEAKFIKDNVNYLYNSYEDNSEN